MTYTKAQVLEIIGDDETEYWQGGKSGNDIHATVDQYASRRNDLRAEQRKRLEKYHEQTNQHNGFHHRTGDDCGVDTIFGNIKGT